MKKMKNLRKEFLQLFVETSPNILGPLPEKIINNLHKKLFDGKSCLPVFSKLRTKLINKRPSYFLKRSM